ncbi:hypothetical protein Pla52o_45710 [Novipirellula galeiformis]|uniref:Carboxypeptidase regulatory-like domain-containing protein n=1 Tax=Novipirellula galeiformis TaxID=2528004 RepID=A0A5C6C933_9BACT|nr:DUF4198 domain-containing protein [Novipirellula galeiformis]TWU20692.1 hypothetical protein Pla52o_45710 [Novipirellula galeiformis]
MSKFFCLSSLALAAFTVALTGCSRGTDVELVPVSGTVTVAGKPTEGITVTLLRQSGEGKQHFPYGKSDAEGKFTLKVSETESGAPVGQYTALFERWTLPDGSPIPEGQTPADSGAVNQIPQRYTDPSTSPETVTIAADGADNLSFDLKLK